MLLLYIVIEYLFHKYFQDLLFSVIGYCCSDKSTMLLKFGLCFVGGSVISVKIVVKVAICCH